MWSRTRDEQDNREQNPKRETCPRVLVMSPDYGSRLQLQKIAMLDVADVVVVNKSDLAAARAATTEIEHRLMLNARGQKVLSTVAKRHGDGGVNQLFGALTVS